jgi:hypothetical protein
VALSGQLAEPLLHHLAHVCVDLVDLKESVVANLIPVLTLIAPPTTADRGEASRT